MPSDADRFRILADLKLSITWYDDKVVVFWRGKAEPGKAAGYLPVSEGPTLEYATDEAIRRHEEKLARRQPRGK